MSFNVVLFCITVVVSIVFLAIYTILRRVRGKTYVERVIGAVGLISGLLGVASFVYSLAYADENVVSTIIRPFVIANNSTVITAGEIHYGSDTPVPEEPESSQKSALEQELSSYRENPLYARSMELEGRINAIREQMGLAPLESNDYLGILAQQLAGVYKEYGTTDHVEFDRQRTQLEKDYLEYFRNNTSLGPFILRRVEADIGEWEIDDARFLERLFVLDDGPGEMGVGIAFSETSGYYIYGMAALEIEQYDRGSPDEWEQYKADYMRFLNGVKYVNGNELLTHSVALDELSEQIADVYTLLLPDWGNEQLVLEAGYQANEAVIDSGLGWQHFCVYPIYNPDPLVAYNDESYAHGRNGLVGEIGMGSAYVEGTGYVMVICFGPVEFEHSTHNFYDYDGEYDPTKPYSYYADQYADPQLYTLYPESDEDGNQFFFSLEPGEDTQEDDHTTISIFF